MKRAMLALGVMVLLAGPAAAQKVTLDAQEGDPSVIVWKDTDAVKRAQVLFKANAHKGHPELLLPLISCMAHTGSGAVVTGGSADLPSIEVIDGDNLGCEGVVMGSDLKR